MMRKRGWIAGGSLALGASLLIGSTPLEAQSVESILRARERLELTEDQVVQLDAIREETVRQRSVESAEIAELRSRLEAGQIERSDLMAVMEDQRDARRARAEERRARVDGLLTEAQRESVQQMRRRAGRRGPGFDRERHGMGPRGERFRGGGPQRFRSGSRPRFRR